LEQNLNINDLLSFSPMDLAQILNDTFIFDIPCQIETEQELNEVGKMLAITSNQYSFLTSMLSIAKVNVRKYKRAKAKTSYEDTVDKRDIISYTVDAVKLRHKTLSRLITVKQERNNELNMSERRQF
jgi:hypothetical protein